MKIMVRQRQLFCLDLMKQYLRQNSW